MKYIIHTDGGARGNPGPAAVGVVIEQSEPSVVSHQSSDKKSLKAEDRRLKTIAEFGKRIGETTNNVAEYTAVIEALKKVKSQKSKVESEICFFLDSNLVVQQLNGIFKVKDANLRKLFFDVRILEQEVGGEVTYDYVPREQNKRADFLVNKALDGPPHVSLL